MSESKPVAWASAPDKITGHSYLKLGSENPNSQIYTVPLYTKGQSQPRVKMTKEQKSTIVEYKNNQAMFIQFIELIKKSGINFFHGFSEEELMIAWLNPEETIEIV